MRSIADILQVRDYQSLDNDEIDALIEYRCDQAAKRAAHDALESARRYSIEERAERDAENAAALMAASQAYEPPVLQVISYG